MRDAYKMIYWVMLLAIFAGCAPIRSYTSVPIVPDKDGLYVTMPATRNMHTIDEAFANQWDRTINVCNQRKQALAREIDDRSARLSRSSNISLLIGGVAGLATTIYSGVADHPKKAVLIPLGAISGTSLISALPALNSDSRLDELRKKLAQVEADEKQAVGLYNQLEGELVKTGLIEKEKKELKAQVGATPAPADLPALKEKLVKVETEWAAQQVKIEGIIAQARTALNNWEFNLR